MAPQELEALVVSDQGVRVAQEASDQEESEVWDPDNPLVAEDIDIKYFRNMQCIFN